MTDIRMVARVVAGVLLAPGAYTEAELARANEALSALGRPALTEADCVADTPERLAPVVPIEMRAAVADLLYELAGDEPIRRRLADAYAQLWHQDPEDAAAPRTGPAVLRWLIGTLPRHHRDGTPEDEENEMTQSPYRSEEVAPQVAPVERSPLRMRVERIRAQYQAVVQTVESVIVGKRDVIERVLTAMAARGHVLLVDVPGVGKTQLCKAIAAAIHTNFGRIQFTPDLLPMDITGTNVFDVKDREFRFRPGPIFTHILLADEINRATPKTQSALLEVMEERCVTIDGVTHQLGEPFQVLATMNPIDHQGTYALPAAQIDRFMIMLEIGYPSPEDEVKVLDYHLGVTPPLASVQPVISAGDLIMWRETVPYVHVTPELKRTVVDYITKLRRTSEEGATISPRATLAWVRAAQARAMLAGREFVTIEDLLDVAPDVLRHRMWTDAATVRERLRSVAIAGARSISARTWRLLALVAPSLIVPLVASDCDAGRVSFATGVALSVLWLVVAAALLVRFVMALHAQFRSRDAASPWDRIDVLTSSGAAMMWFGLVALIAVSSTGWASLGVVGVLGVGTVSIAALWTILVAAGDGPWQRAQILRTVLPAVATEGDPLREEITLRDLAIPPGMRLFVQGRAQRHGKVSRYVVDGGASGEVVLRAELGPALRGEHPVPPLALWFGDVLGLTRTAVVHRGATELAVMPRQLAVEGARTLLGEGGDDANAKPTHKMPTEGTFRIRTYTPGDDARRIHWVRSLQQDQLIVRLPDEIPPADPTVRLVLDNELFGTDSLTCRAPDDMLDALVRVWLGIAKELAAQGTRVTLVAAVDGKVCERTMHPRSAQAAMRFGAKISWQAAVPLERVVGDHRDKHVIVSARPRRVVAEGKSDQVGWVVVPEVAWTNAEAPLPVEHGLRYGYPVGSPENRRERRARDRARAVARWQDRAVFSQVTCWIDWSRFSGDHVARPNERGGAELEMIP